MIRKMMSKEEELSHVSFVKTALMFLVIIGHSVAFWNGTWFTKDPVIEAPFLGLVYSWLGSFHIYAFALVSGYLFSYVKYERNGYNRYAQFLSKKALRLLVHRKVIICCFSQSIMVFMDAIYCVFDLLASI